VNDLELELVEGMLAALERSPGADSERLDRLREKLLTLKLIRKIEAKEKPVPRWWQSEWFFRLLVLVLALLIGVIDLKGMAAGWIK
jgi:hypothetical protein